jgi:hypothetical protein
VERSGPGTDRDRVVRRSGAVFALSLSAAALTVAVGFGVAFAACTGAVAQIFSNLGTPSVSYDVAPIPIPQRACPYLRLVSAAAANAGAPWHDALAGPGTWSRFTHELTGPLADLDAALGAAVPRVPDPVAQDLRTVRHDVQIGRVELFAAGSVSDYMGRSQVFEGYTSLVHAGALVGNACGAALAPPLPF